MSDIKLSIFNKLDEKNFKKIASEREKYLNSGDSENLDLNYKANEVAGVVHPERMVLIVTDKFDENYQYKILVLSHPEKKELPVFKAGQKIAITVEIDGIYYTRPYYLSCSPFKALEGQYYVTVKNDNSDIVSNYLYNHINLTEKVIVSSPFGNFYYNSLRDEKNVLAIVSESGIIPVYAMMQSIIEGNEDYNLHVLYSEKYEKDLLFKDKLIEYSNSSNKISVSFVLSKEKENEDYLSGFVSKTSIQNDFKNEQKSIFIAGDEGLLKYLDKELIEFKIPKKYIRYDNFLPRCNIKKVIKYNLTIYVNSEKYEIVCYNNKTIMKAIEESGIYIPSKCQNGSCGFCRSELVKGKVKVVNDKRNISDKKLNYIHPCTTYPASDIEIIIR